jgi:hypothetical protein
MLQDPGVLAARHDGGVQDLGQCGGGVLRAEGQGGDQFAKLDSR